MLDAVKEVLIIMGISKRTAIYQDIQPGAQSCSLTGVFLHYLYLFLWWE